MSIKATYKATMSEEWFIEFIKQLAIDNPNQLVEIVDTGLIMHFTGTNKIWNTPTCVYSFTGTFGTLKNVAYGEWLTELRGHIAATRSPRPAKFEGMVKEGDEVFALYSGVQLD